MEFVSTKYPSDFETLPPTKSQGWALSHMGIVLDLTTLHNRQTFHHDQNDVCLPVIEILA